jgi:hypothetical protein
VRLSDGGGADNLGLISLIRRGVSDVIVVDAAQDNRGLMDDLCWARKALNQEGLTMTFPNLERFRDLCDRQFGGSPDSQRLAYNTSAWMNPVVPGKVAWGASGRKTNLWLIKAAWNEQAIRQAYNAIAFHDGHDCGPEPGQINCLLLAFYGHSTKFRDKNDKYMVFPQHGTAGLTANNSSYSFIAYRELGRMLGSHLRRNPSGHLEIVNDPGCTQPAFPAAPHGRPQNYYEVAAPSCNKADHLRAENAPALP